MKQNVKGFKQMAQKHLTFCKNIMQQTIPKKIK